jgi:hypothetical protein
MGCALRTGLAFKVLAIISITNHFSEKVKLYFCGQAVLAAPGRVRCRK